MKLKYLIDCLDSLEANTRNEQNIYLQNMQIWRHIVEYTGIMYHLVVIHIGADPDDDVKMIKTEILSRVSSNWNHVSGDEIEILLVIFYLLSVFRDNRITISVMMMVHAKGYDEKL